MSSGSKSGDSVKAEVTQAVERGWYDDEERLLQVKGTCCAVLHTHCRGSRMATLERCQRCGYHCHVACSRAIKGSPSTRFCLWCLAKAKYPEEPVYKVIPEAVGQPLINRGASRFAKSVVFFETRPDFEVEIRRLASQGATTLDNDYVEGKGDEEKAEATEGEELAEATENESSDFEASSEEESEDDSDAYVADDSSPEAKKR